MRIPIIMAILPIIATSCVVDDYRDKRGKGDAPVGIVDDAPSDVANFPDGFSNIATKCIGSTGFRGFVITRQGKTAAPPVVVADEACR
jgi:hypothetical protein